MISDAKTAGKPTPRAKERATRQSRTQPLECAACEAAQEAVAALLRRAAEPGDAGDDLNWAGICNTHAWRLAVQPAAARRLAAARLRASLDRLAAGDAAPAGRGRLSRREQGPSFGPEGDCPFCAAMTAAARVLAARVKDDAGEAGSWCIPHLCAALGLVHGRDRVRAVAQVAVEHFSALEEDLSELIRKSDYRFRGEPRGREATSWLRAAHLVAGAPGVRWALRREPGLEG